MRDKKATAQHKPTYISLFSSAGVGCHGFQTEGFECIATVELLEKRLNIQKYNKKCLYDTGYIVGDLCDENVQSKIRGNIEYYHTTLKRELDVLIATPPCQGMSVANHKKGNETKRNSLIVESIRLTKEFSPKIFIFENVSAFLHTLCTDIDNTEKKIEDVIEINLGGTYNILSKVINFKNYGSNSSRTRTIVIGIRKDQKNITPFDFFPTKQPEKTLYEVIGELPSLREIGEINEFDIYHQFKKYNPEMRSWIQDIKEGESAFDNIDISKVPHKKENGIIVINQNKNGDKYKRQFYNKVAPCIHTRNDILASQNTIHPKDDRVFSIRELMRMMTIPSDFKWTEDELSELNQLPISEKVAFLKKWEMTIRHSIGEAVPTIIFEQIANKISAYLHRKYISQSDILRYIEEYDLTKTSNLLEFLEKNTLGLDYTSLLNIAEYSNTKRDESAAYYTSQDIVYSLVKNLPEAKNYKELHILEPSVGIGSFIPTIIKKYEDVARVIIDVVDINNDSLNILRILLGKIHIPNNIIINYHHNDFLKFESETRYDIVIGNPPFGKGMIEKKHSLELREHMENKSTGNVFAFFIEKACKIGNIVSFIVPKSLLSAPEFNQTRQLLNKFDFLNIIDYGEFGFKGVKIETICIIFKTKPHKLISKSKDLKIESYIQNNIRTCSQNYIFDENYPNWLIYRDTFFDKIAEKMEFGIFCVFRDRQITKKNLQPHGKIRVLKSRNIASNKIVDIEGYDCYIDDIGKLAIKKYINRNDILLIPNLTYNPRGCILPYNTITDGSVALLEKKIASTEITIKNIEYYASKEFKEFYMIARNHGTRSLNIDSNSVFYFGKHN